MAILMSMAIAANMIASVPVCATDIFTDSMPTDSAITQETDDDSFSDGSGTPDFADEQENVQAAQDEGTQSAKEPPVVTAKYDSVFGSPIYKIEGQFGSDYFNDTLQISVRSNNSTANLTKVFFSSSLKKGEYYMHSTDQYIQFSADSFTVNDQIVITSTGYKDLTLKVTGTGKQWAVERVTSQTEPEQPKDAPEIDGSYEKDINVNYMVLKPTGENGATGYIENITEIDVDEQKWAEVGSKLSLFSNRGYYLDKNNGQIVFDPTKLYTGNVLTIKSSGYHDLYLKVTRQGENFKVEKTASGKTNISGASNGVNTLHIRLSGYFESAVTGQKKYDAVTSASNSTTSNKNSYVTVQAADILDNNDPGDNDWKNLKDMDIDIDTKKTTVNIVSADGKDIDSGMTGTYSPYDSSLSLNGTPKDVGNYLVSVTVTDKSGRTVTSDPLSFKIYSKNEKLADHLKLANATPTSDGKYMYDMDPWLIPYFNNDTDDVVTVPAEIKAWYGSHTSGTYGELGYAVSEGEATTQILIIPDGCNLTMVNMKVLSSVKIKVENGGTLNLRDSSIYGQIEVENGGTISVNHDDYSKQFLTGTSINGQLILNDGATIKNSMIYSNTNFLTDDKNDKKRYVTIHHLLL